MQPYRLHGSPRAFAHVLAMAILFLLLANTVRLVLRFGFGHDYLMGLGDLFDFHQEGNIPTFFSVLLALFGVVLLAIIAFDARHRGSRDARYWFMLAAGFLFLAYDEAFQVHEKMIGPMAALLGRSDAGVLHFGWILPAVLAVMALALVFLRFLLRMPAATRHRLLAAGALFLGGCLGLELISGNHFASHGDTFTYHLLVMAEEGLEMAGLATMIHALVSHIAASGKTLEFDLHEEQAAATPVLPAVRPEYN